MMKQVLVTGATGFTGGYLCKRLVAEGYSVRGLALPDQKIDDLVNAGVQIVTGDLTEENTLIPAVSGIDIIYHIAAVYREEGIPKNTFWDVNVQGTKNLLEAAKEAGVKRFVHCSTVGVQGEIKEPPANENAPFNPGDYYQQSKLEGEILALEYFKKEGLPVVVFRPVGIYGPGDTRFLKLFKYIKKGKFRMFGSGNVLYHLTYIDDLIDGILLVGETSGIEGEVFNLAGERYTTLNELVQIIGKVLNVDVSKHHYPVWPVWIAGAIFEIICRPLRINPPIYRRRVDFFIKDRAFDITKAKQILKYNPRIDLQTGITKTAEWYKEQGLLD
jgi:nucleoside-diphosphate-sugar epimerase